MISHTGPTKLGRELVVPTTMADFGLFSVLGSFEDAICRTFPTSVCYKSKRCLPIDGCLLFTFQLVLVIEVAPFQIWLSLGTDLECVLF